QLFEIMKGLPVKIRLLDPPLHEFLPKKEIDIKALAGEMGVSEEVIRDKIETLQEFNPMMGHRGCRLGITFPEIFQMQVKAIIAAASEVNQNLTVEIMIPLISDVEELKWLKDKLIPVIEGTIKQGKKKIKYQVGVMIEVPRAALMADEIAQEADFFSFGTNDLTQMTYGFSRDDANKFLKEYLKQKILKEDPFKQVDEKGVGQLMVMAVDKGRRVKKNLNIGICGEQGGDPSTIKFCHKIGLDYVSCSPYRVPIAILAAAQAAVEEEKKSK
ncbi:MAG TPA: pyruvate, phosphate dikinase, partial [Candidatus Woesebacteria bacterium]|nr:pyruvate, phosphate dikinase [Candidatus Woesebacteria bacterium]